MNVVDLSKFSGDAGYRSVESMLADEIELISSGKRKANKAMVLFLDDKEGVFNAGFGNAGLSCSQMLALLEVAKTLVLDDMGYLVSGCEQTDMDE